MSYPCRVRPRQQGGGKGRRIQTLMKIRAALLALTAVLAAFPASAGPRLVTLGTDPALDGPPALDVTYLKVGAAKGKLEIRIGIENMLPVVAGYPALPGIEWAFKVGGRTFIAEAVAGTPEPEFYLFELQDGAFTQLETPAGTYDPASGYASIIIPFKTIGARSGSHVMGAPQEESGGDVDAHVHLGATTWYPDAMTTTKHYRIP